MRKSILLPAFIVLSGLAAYTPASSQRAGCRFDMAIYFPFGMSTMDKSAMDLVDLVAVQTAGCPPPLIVLEANNDSQEQATLPRIGQARLNAVAAELRKRMKNVAIVTQDLGFSNPQLATKPNVREPLNRRVVVHVR